MWLRWWARRPTTAHQTFNLQLSILNPERSDRCSRHRAASSAPRGCGSARPGLDAAADIVWTLFGPDVFLFLVVECGWLGDRYET